MPELHGMGSGHLELESATNKAIVGGEVYPMAAALSHHLSLHHRTGLALGPATLELGAGTGAVGLYAAALGARCTLTDKHIARAALQPQSYGGEGNMEVIAGMSSFIIEMLQRNASVNAAHFAHQPLVCNLDWSDSAHVERAYAESPNGAGFDLILGSDVTYSTSSHATLVATIARLLRPHIGDAPPSIALIAHDTRRLDVWGEDVQLRSFQDAALACGLQVRRSRLQCEETGSEGYLLRLTL